MRYATSSSTVLGRIGAILVLCPALLLPTRAAAQGEPPLLPTRAAAQGEPPPLLLPARTAAQAEAPLLLREPALSATSICFTFAEDIWVVPRAGGEARRLTASPGPQTGCRFSPDGARIAYTGTADGNTDVYVVAAGGGVPARLTYHPGTDIAFGWTPDR